MRLIRLKKVFGCVFGFLAICFIINSCSPETNFESNPTVDNTDYSFSEEFEFGGFISSQKRMTVTGVSGSIIFRLTDSNEYIVTVSKIVHSESESDATDYMSNLRVNHESSGNSINISTVQPIENNGRDLIVNYSIVVPKYLEIEVVQKSGDVTLDSIYSKTIIEQENGTVELIDHNGNINIMLDNGSVIGNVNIPTNLEGLCVIGIINGTLNLELPVATSAQFFAAITNGRIDITNLDFINIESSLNRFRGQLNQGDATIDLQVENGRIEVEGY